MTSDRHCKSLQLRHLSDLVHKASTDSLRLLQIGGNIQQIGIHAGGTMAVVYKGQWVYIHFKVCRQHTLHL